MVRIKLVSVQKSTMPGKLFHALTIRSLKNLARTVEEECFIQLIVVSMLSGMSVTRWSSGSCTCVNWDEKTPPAYEVIELTNVVLTTR